MSAENSLKSEKPKTLFEEIGLATFKDGFILGIFIALILQLGIIDITTSTQKAIVYFFLFAGIVTSINQAFRRKSLINPPTDGFISGFGTFIGIIELIIPLISTLATNNLNLYILFNI